MARVGESGSGASSGVAGNNTDVQFNNVGTLAGSDNFTFDGSNTNLPNGISQAVGFVWSRYINVDITVPDHYSMINSNMVLLGSVTLTLLGDAELILL